MHEITIDTKKIPFDNKVREMCKSCKRYGFKATCPPNTESVDYYSNILTAYKNGIIYYDIFECKDLSEWKKIGIESSLAIHYKLLDVRQQLFNKGHYFVVIFGAGSCKLCPTGCTFPCRQPQSSIIPLEATGVNVVELMKQYNVDITFPVKNSIYRLGLILYD